MDVGLQHFIYNRTNLSHILVDQQELGAHTDIVEFQSTKVSTFRWTHPGTRPMGVSISKQCSACSCLRTLKPIVSSDNSQVMLKCTICKKTTVYAFPSGWEWAHRSPDKNDARGSWLVLVEPQENEDLMHVE